MAATIRDVAALAGVSPSTVSNYLCGRLQRMRPETRQRVEAAIGHLGYQVNQGARGLVSGESKLIGIVCQASTQILLSHPYTPMLLAAVQAVVFPLGYQLLTSACHGFGESQGPTMRSFCRRRVQGVLITNRAVDDHSYRLLQKAGIPYVVLNRHPEEQGGYAVLFDDQGGASQVADHLMELGHRRFGVISGYRGYAHHRLRVHGFVSRLQEAGLNVPADFIIESDGSPEGGASAARRLLSLSPPPTAIYATNDFAATGAIGEARRMGLRVPDDLAVVGNDDVEFAGHLTPSLTTISLPVREHSVFAADMLLRLIRGEKPDPSIVVFPVKLIARESTLGVRPSGSSEHRLTGLPMASVLPRAPGLQMSAE